MYIYDNMTLCSTIIYTKTNLFIYTYGTLLPLLTKEARTRFVNDPIDIGRERERGVATKGAPGRLPCVDPAPTGPSGKRLSMNGQRCP